MELPQAPRKASADWDSDTDIDNLERYETGPTLVANSSWYACGSTAKPHRPRPAHGDPLRHMQTAGTQSLTTDAVRSQPSRRTVHKLFKGFDLDMDGTVSLDEFVKIILETLVFDLSVVEATRMFQRADANGNGALTLDEFKEAIGGDAFFRNLVDVITCHQLQSFTLPSDYDYSKSTAENYGVPTREFVGDYASIRAERDYTYHVNYIEERQRWQDAVIKTVVVRTKRLAWPWIIFTCGPMGAGKGFAISWMSTNGYLPKEGVVHIDPDHFKQRMPEFKGYAALGPNAGSLCHLESCFMQEMAQELALRGKQHILVDGSLRDSNWYGKVFDDIRERFPSYRIAIFYVHAPESKVRERVLDRARLTGRAVPEQTLVESMRAAEKSVAALTKKCDLVVRISNGGETPELEAVATIDHSGKWDSISRRLATDGVNRTLLPSWFSV